MEENKLWKKAHYTVQHKVRRWGKGTWVWLFPDPSPVTPLHTHTHLLSLAQRNPHRLRGWLSHLFTLYIFGYKGLIILVSLPRELPLQCI